MTLLAKVKIWTSFLLIILVAGMLCDCGSHTPEATLPSDTSSIMADSVEVVYFHRAQRCYSCIYAEQGTRFTLETYFKDELNSNQIILKVVNIEDKKNSTVVKKYGAFTSSLFTNAIKNGTDHIEEVKEIWFVLGNDKAFVEVVRSKIEENLKGIR